MSSNTSNTEKADMLTIGLPKQSETLDNPNIELRLVFPRVDAVWGI